MTMLFVKLWFAGMHLLIFKYAIQQFAPHQAGFRDSTPICSSGTLYSTYISIQLRRRPRKREVTMNDPLKGKDMKFDFIPTFQSIDGEN